MLLKANTAQSTFICSDAMVKESLGATTYVAFVEAYLPASHFLKSWIRKTNTCSYIAAD